MALSTFRNAVNGVLTIEDGTPTTPLSVEVVTTVGDFNITNLKNVLNETVNVMARNRLIGTAPGPRIIPEISFSAQVDALSHATSDHVTDMVLGLDKYAARVSTVANDWTVHFNVTWTVGDDVITCTDVEFTTGITESTEVNTVQFTGVVRGTVTINGVELAEIAAPT